MKRFKKQHLFYLFAILALVFETNTSKSIAAFPLYKNEYHQNTQVSKNLNGQIQNFDQDAQSFDVKSENNKPKKDKGLIGLLALLSSILGFTLLFIVTSSVVISLPLVILGGLITLLGFVLGLIGIQEHRKNKLLSIIALIPSGFVLSMLFLVGLTALIISA
jgi:hypothetical protein